VVVDTGSVEVDAVVVPKPFIDPKKNQPKQDVSSLVGAGSRVESTRPAAAAAGGAGTAATAQS